MGMGWKWSWSVWLVFKTKIVNHRRQLCTKPYHIQRSWYNERNYLYTPVGRWSEKHSQHLQLAICVSVHPEPWPLNFWGPFPDLQWIDYCWLLVGPSLGGRLSVYMYVSMNVGLQYAQMLYIYKYICLYSIYVYISHEGIFILGDINSTIPHMAIKQYWPPANVAAICGSRCPHCIQ